ncbi:MAG: aspartate aminotransferase family protein [Rhodospirillales bacterium]|nr:aspartate aminotransferase family protein [Rhodospirillales bacterium]MDH3909995.1 aspartate aminotransferase family protein [Rhodospirillales bacterium]MDH3965503.1 aspartate aminotransferase family protein [Rhodospirillales bacterium]
MREIERAAIAALMAREVERFAAERPKSRALSERAKAHLLAGTPLTWMREWQSPFTVFAERALGATVVDVDGHEYADFCLGDTGAMFGHSPAPFVELVTRTAGQGITTMLPTEDSVWLGAELAQRFGLPVWSLALTATDANRFACRFARELTGRPKILVFDGCYHGTLGETLVDLNGNGMIRRPASIGVVEDPETTTRVVDFNDLEQLDRALAAGDVACVLAEPALTNCGMVLPDPGFHDGLRGTTRRHGTLLIIDETHTLSSGPAGYTGASGLEPDMLTLGKPIAGGIPAAVYGFTAELAERIDRRFEELGDFSTGVGGTLSANALSVRAMRVMFEQVITEQGYEHMFAMAVRLEEGIDGAIARHDLPWHVTRMGARVEYGINPTPWKNAKQVRAGCDPELERLLHLYCLNRGVLVTPFHNMMLTSPATTEAQVDRHSEAFESAVAELAAG